MGDPDVPALFAGAHQAARAQQTLIQKNRWRLLSCGVGVAFLVPGLLSDAPALAVHPSLSLAGTLCLLPALVLFYDLYGAVVAAFEEGDSDPSLVTVGELL
jgi:hypothetical protein